MLRASLLPPETTVENVAFAERLFDRFPDLVFFVKNLRGEYVHVNQSMVRRLGVRNKEELLGRTARDVYPNPMGNSYYEQDLRVVNTCQETRDFLETHLYEDRTLGWCITQKLPLMDRNGRVAGVVGVSRDLQRPYERREEYANLAGALSHLREHLSESVQVEELARIAELSIDRFERLTKRVFHLTPGQLIIRMRVETAMDMLRDSGNSVSSIAYACGYADQSAFTRQFKATVGLTPREYRQTSSQRPRPIAPTPSGSTPVQSHG